MKRPPANLFSVLLIISPALAQLPYNPSRTIVTSNGSLAYTFSQSSLTLLDIADRVNTSSAVRTISSRLPFFSSSTSTAYIPIADTDGITVLAGDCSKAAKGLDLWRFVPGNTSNGTWSPLELTLDDTSSSANYLSAGFFFSADGTTRDGSIYIFGGMCPTSNSTTADWTSDATYSNTMLTLSADSSSSKSPPSGAPYQLSITGERAPPIAEAGLSITPLLPTFSNPASQNGSQQQNFVLIGGHTSTAFINMSQIALYSLPQQSWAFLGIDQPTGAGSGELMIRDNAQIEPRSGHTAILTEDGSQIIVFGGWVGDVATPATPQLAVLEIGQGYGGTGDWAWRTVNQAANPFQSSEGIYGHSAVMLPGGVMMVQGGYSIGTSTSKVKRQSENSSLLFFNATSSTWVSSYANPGAHSPAHSGAGGQHDSSNSKSSDMAGLGAGIGFGIAAILAVAFAWYVYAQRKKQERLKRERELRDLALGSEAFASPLAIDTGVGDRGGMGQTGFRTASWGDRQEKNIGLSGNAFPWAPVISEDSASRLRLGNDHEDDSAFRQAERTGLLMEIPSPTRGLRRNFHSRGGYGVPGPGGPVFRIDEEEEGASSQNGSLRRSRAPVQAGDRTSDPFEDPAAEFENRNDNKAEGRKKELQAWVDDWQSAAESLNLSRNPSQAHSRTYSNLSQNQATIQGSSGRGSPEKSDRTGSNLSEKSMTSNLSVTKGVSRNVSQRSASAGYTLFSSAAAAVGRITGTRDYGTNSLDRSSSRRSVSQPHDPRSRGETFSSMTFQPSKGLPGEAQSLLPPPLTRPTTGNDDFHTPPESPSKQRELYGARTGSLTSSGRKALGMLGSVKRVFTGTGSVDVSHKVAMLETKETPGSSPTKSQPEMTEVSPTKAAGFWKSKRGAKDWDDLEESVANDISTIRRKPVAPESVDRMEDDDWDPEVAVRNRVVQVMFTVPKERLRVVNADALSLISRSDADEGELGLEKEIKRMSSVRELDEDERYSPIRGLDEANGDGEGTKGKARAL